MDQGLGGISPNDLILAFESEPNEIERRITYQMLADSFYRTLRKDYPTVHLNYMDWVVLSVLGFIPHIARREFVSRK